MPRTVVITGASSGIGKAIALRCAAQGDRLALLGRHKARLTDVARTCSSLGSVVHTALIDVRARQEMSSWLEGFDQLSPVDLLFANAGVMSGRPPEGLLEDQIDSLSLFETNVLGVVNTVHPLLPRMIARGRGQIAIIGSLAGFVPVPDAPSYCASKAAVMNYGLALRSLLGPKGVRISVVCPGYVETPMTAQEQGAKPFKMPAEQAAELIMRGLERNQAVIAFPFWLTLMSRLGGLLPDWVRQRTQEPHRFTVSKLPN
jgi:short-subunit dehydrogenase